MNRLVYTLVFYLSVPLILLRLLLRAKNQKAYAKRWLERFGFVPTRQKTQPAIWVHSVSVGETLAAVPLIKAIERRYPNYRLIITTMTPTGSDRVRALYGKSVTHFYMPYDLPGAVLRFLDRVKPNFLLLMETELWPNLIAACDLQSVPVMLANARLSERSAARYGKFPKLTKPMLARLAKVSAQSPEDAARFAHLGLDNKKISVCGNIKFDVSVNETAYQAGQILRKVWLKDQPNGKILLAASTHKGEEEQIIAAFLKLQISFPSLRLLLVPRHIDRLVGLKKLLEQNQLGWTYRSDESALNSQQKVILGNTMGEMMLLFATADVVFMGGSLMPVGGHNMLEPALYGLPIITGPHVFNFSQVVAKLKEQQGIALVANAEELRLVIEDLLTYPDKAISLGTQAESVLQQNRGALDCTLGQIDDLLKAGLKTKTG